jgi:hypothetical protein
MSNFKEMSIETKVECLDIMGDKLLRNEIVFLCPCFEEVCHHNLEGYALLRYIYDMKPVFPELYSMIMRVGQSYRNMYNKKYKDRNKKYYDYNNYEFSDPWNMNDVNLKVKHLISLSKTLQL